MLSRRSAYRPLPPPSNRAERPFEFGARAGRGLYLNSAETSYGLSLFPALRESLVKDMPQ